MGFFKALTHMDGRRLAREILAMSVDGNCKVGGGTRAEERKGEERGGKGRKGEERGGKERRPLSRFHLRT